MIPLSEQPNGRLKISLDLDGLYGYIVKSNKAERTYTVLVVAGEGFAYTDVSIDDVDLP